MESGIGLAASLPRISLRCIRATLAGRPQIEPDLLSRLVGARPTPVAVELLDDQKCTVRERQGAKSSFIAQLNHGVPEHFANDRREGFIGASCLSNTTRGPIRRNKLNWFACTPCLVTRNPLGKAKYVGLMLNVGRPLPIVVGVGTRVENEREITGLLEIVPYGDELNRGANLPGDYRFRTESIP